MTGWGSDWAWELLQRAGDELATGCDLFRFLDMPYHLLFPNVLSKHISNMFCLHLRSKQWSHDFLSSLYSSTVFYNKLNNNINEIMMISNIKYNNNNKYNRI